MNTLNFNACFKCKQLLHRTILHSNTSTKKKTCLCCENCEIIIYGVTEYGVLGFIYKNYCMGNINSKNYIYFFQNIKTDYSTFLEFNNCRNIHFFEKDLSSIEDIIYLIKFIDNLEFL